MRADAKRLIDMVVLDEAHYVMQPEDPEKWYRKAYKDIGSVMLRLAWKRVFITATLPARHQQQFKEPLVFQWLAGSRRRRLLRTRRSWTASGIYRTSHISGKVTKWSSHSSATQPRQEGWGGGRPRPLSLHR